MRHIPELKTNLLSRNGCRNQSVQSRGSSAAGQKTRFEDVPVRSSWTWAVSEAAMRIPSGISSARSGVSSDERYDSNSPRDSGKARASRITVSSSLGLIDSSDRLACPFDAPAADGL